MFPVDLMYGYYTMNKPNNKLDVVIVEASAITEEGGIVPGASVGASPELIQMADKVLENNLQAQCLRLTTDTDHYRSQYLNAILRGSP